MSSAEMSEWMAYAEVEPFGAEREDLRAGIVASTIANVNRGKNKKAFKAVDFMPKFERKKKQSAADMFGFFKALEKNIGNDR